MEQIKKNLLLLLVLTAVTASHLHAQENTNRRGADSVMVNKLAADLGIPKQKARQLYRVMNYKPTAELEAITNNPNIPTAEKGMLVKKLMKARHRRIDSLLTPAQKQLFLQKESATLQQAQAAGAAGEQRHRDEMDQVPHQVVRQSGNYPDSLKHHKS